MSFRTDNPQAEFFLMGINFTKGVVMKKLFLYILLPGIVLGIVYQSGRSSGEKSALERAPLVNEVAPVRSVPVVASNAPVAKSNVAPKAPVVKPNVAPNLSVPKPNVAPKASVVRLDAVPSNSSSEPVDRFVVRQIPHVSETDSVSSSPSNQGVVRVPQPVFAEPLPKYDWSKPSELGLVPLAPLEPLESAAVYKPGVVPVPAAVPSKSSFVSPVRITSSSECDCGKSHQ
jgi:hypothetical protein